MFYSIMNMVLCIFYVLLDLLTFTVANIENIDLNYTSVKLSYDELYNDALIAYGEDRHQDASKYFERALSDYRHLLLVKSQCWIRCQDNYKKIHLSDVKVLDGQLNFLHYMIKIKSCTELCQEKFVDRRGRVDRQIKQKFETREPYNYLQYSYFKLGELEKSLNAAYTYFEVHPDNEMMKDNIDWLSKTLGKDVSTLVSLEQCPHIAHYKEGEKAYDQKNYTQCINSFEESLRLFYKEAEKCNAVCETEHERQQGSYSTTLFNHFKAVIECRQRCRLDLTRISGRTSSVHFVPYYYHYLQFCYYQLGNFYEAAIAADSYILMIPNDPIMVNNLMFYRRQPAVKKKTIKPRPMAKLYFKQFAMELSLLQLAKGYAAAPLEGSRTETLQDDEQHLDAVYNAVEEDIVKEGPARGEAEKMKISQLLREKSYRNQGRWKENNNINDSLLIMEEEQLNGTDRVAFDNVANEKQCQQLMNLVQKLARSGDGYEHSHKDAAHPFTEKEVFKGITVRGAVDAIETNIGVTVSDVELYVNMSEKVRLLTQEYFDLPVRLNFAFTHLVCRHALEEAMDGGEHLSHPLHSDNCVLNADGPGTCPKRSPAYTWRDYSALLYLNGDFKGGEFIFADYNEKIQARLKPECGRMVAFRSNGVHNLHGVLGVTSGVRCALSIWFTLSNRNEDNRASAEKKLEIIKQRLMGSAAGGTTSKQEL